MKKTGSLVLWVAVVVLVMVAAYTVYSKNRINNNITQAPRTGTSEKAQDFTLTDLNGKNVKLSDYKGKVVFLNFWASWCPPCKAEMPVLHKAGKELAKGNDAVLVTINEGESADTVKKFLTANNYNFTVLLDQDGKVGNAYKVTGIPTTFIINKDGTIYDSVVGPIEEAKVLSLARSLSK